MKYLIMSITAIIVFTCTEPVAFADMKIGDPAKPTQIRGYWQVVEWPVEVKRQWNKIRDPWPSRYQWFIYSTENHMYHINLNYKPRFEFTTSYLRDFYEKSQPVMRYQASEGYMWVYYSGDNLREVWRVSFAGGGWRGKGITLKTGDLMMALLDSNGHEVYYRQLRRVR